jgi:hypothetical protein
MSAASSKPRKPRKIAGYTVERVSVGGHDVGQIVIDENVTVLFRLGAGGGTGSPGISSSCLACRISKISECASLVCPEIKKEDPNASCSDAILECVALACRPSCRGAGVFGGGLLVLA